MLPRPDRKVGQGGRVVLDQRVAGPQLVERIKKLLGVHRVGGAYGRGAPDAYQTIGVCPGAGASLVEAAITQGCEAFFTGEMRHHEIAAAQARGCTIILAGHTNTERGYLQLLKRRLEKELPGRKVVVSTADVSPMHFF